MEEAGEIIVKWGTVVAPLVEEYVASYMVAPDKTGVTYAMMEPDDSERKPDDSNYKGNFLTLLLTSMKFITQFKNCKMPCYL